MNTFKIRNNHGSFINVKLKVGEWIENTNGIYEIIQIDNDQITTNEVLFDEEGNYQIDKMHDLKFTRSEISYCYYNKN